MNFCPKCRKFLCSCLVAASIVGSVGGWWKGDPQAKLVPARAVDSLLTSATTGTTSSAQVTFCTVNQITGQSYVGVWPDQRRPAVLAATGPGGGPQLPGPGPAGNASDFPKDPIGRILLS
jgi:hypothetical protein